MSTTIKTITGSILNDSIAEGIAVFVQEEGKYRPHFQEAGWDFSPTPDVRIQPLNKGIAKYLICLDNESNHGVKSVKAMRAQVFVTLDVFAEAHVRTVAMNGIKVNKIPDETSRPEAYQRQFVEEYVAAHPDAFDTICLVDLHGGFDTMYITLPLEKNRKTIESENIKKYNLEHPNQGLTHVRIRKGVTKIMKETFFKCQKLKSIILPNSVQIIGDRAFKDCQSLESVKMPNSVKVIGEEAFAECVELKSVITPGKIDRMGKRAFWGCKNMTSFGHIKNQKRIAVIPPAQIIKEQQINGEKIRRIILGLEDGVFENCISLTSVKLSNGVKEIGNDSFKGCEGLSSVIIPEGIEEIGYGAFSDCKNLTDVSLKGTLIKVIRRNTFSNCKKLQKVIVPNSVKIINGFAFAGCEELKTVFCQDEQNISLERIGSFAFIGCNKLKSIAGLGSHTHHGDYAFFDCKSLNQEENVFAAGLDAENQQEFFREQVFSETINAMGDAIVQNYNDWMVHNYKWPMDEGQEKCTTKYEVETIEEFNEYSKTLRTAVERLSDTECDLTSVSLNIEQAIVDILKWGNLPNLKDCTQPEDFTAALIKIRKSANNDVNYKLGLAIKPNGDGIAFWSKVLAAYEPGVSFIYDSRVALALSYISLKCNDKPCFWHIPTDKGNPPIPQRRFRDFNGTVEEVISNNRKNFDEQKVPICYSLYLDLLKALADKIYTIYTKINNEFDPFATKVELNNKRIPTSGNIKNAYLKVFNGNGEEKMKKAIMAHLEKMLFMMKEKILQ